MIPKRNVGKTITNFLMCVQNEFFNNFYEYKFTGILCNRPPNFFLIYCFLKKKKNVKKNRKPSDGQKFLC